MTTRDADEASTTLGPALDGVRATLSCGGGTVSYYVDGPEQSSEPPLVLVHSVNAAASAFEVRPVFERFARRRRVYALDLPGYGHSERGDRPYTPRLMTDAVAALADLAASRDGAAPDALAVSLGTEFLARASVESPGRFRALVLVSPTAMNGTRPRRGPPGADLGRPAMLRIVRALGDGPFALLTTRRSIAYFLRRTFGSANVDPALVDYAYRTSHQPGARHAPYRFLSGFLFSADAYALYEALSPPVWVVHGTRGDFQDYRLAAALAGREGWTRTVMETGALPYFERGDDFNDACEAFLRAR